MPIVPDRTHTAIEAFLAAAAALGETPTRPPERFYSASDKPFSLSPCRFRRWAAETRGSNGGHMPQAVDAPANATEKRPD